MFSLYRNEKGDFNLITRTQNPVKQKKKQHENPSVIKLQSKETTAVGRIDIEDTLA